jgi:serine/threonine protein kinase
MSITSGSRLGVYEVLSPLGAGAMGEVWRARDTRLSREVALKVLPESLSRDHERLQRFEREAQVLASLNHPVSPRSTVSRSQGRPPRARAGRGPTLDERIKQAPPRRRAVAIARQIAEAWDSRTAGSCTTI